MNDINPGVLPRFQSWAKFLKNCSGTEKVNKSLFNIVLKPGKQQSMCFNIVSHYKKAWRGLRYLYVDMPGAKSVVFLRILTLSHPRGGFAMCRQAEHQASAQMADPAREEEQVTLLGEEGLRAGGQALKLGLVSWISFKLF